MEAWVLTLVTLAVAILLKLVINRLNGTKYKLPPGPPGDLLFGHALRAGKNRYLHYSNIADEYGEIFSLRIFSHPVVILSSQELIKEAFSLDWLQGRLIDGFGKEVTSGGHGLLFSQGELWRDQRRFALSVLRDFGFGRSKIEMTIQDELQYLRSILREQNGRPFAPQKAYAKCVSNVIASLVFNERCSEDPEYEKLVEVVQGLGSRGPLSFIFFRFWTIIRLIPGDFSRLKSLKKDLDSVIEYVRGKYKRHQETFDPSNIRDYIDAFLLQMKNPNNESKTFTETQLLYAIYDLFLAGAETTSTTLLWASIFLAENPEVQSKVHDEIDRVIGDKLPETSDRQKLRYTDAVVHEILRYSTPVPLAGHLAQEAGQFRGYDIPKGAVVVPNLFHVHRNQKLWQDPHNFNPENFLDSEGNLVNVNNLIVFGQGKRQCLGESLAKQEIFIFLVGLLQQFQFLKPSDQQLPGVFDCEVNSLVRAPRHFEVIIKPRFAD